MLEKNSQQKWSRLLAGLFILIDWPLLHEGVGEVSGEVDAEADGDDDVGRSHDVDGQTPEVHEAADIRLEQKPVLKVVLGLSHFFFC